MKNPQVSVLMSVFNGERYLAQAVESILTQSTEDFEFLIVDDGSDDGTKEILEGFHDPRLRVFHNDENLGYVACWNFALGRARGEFVARMDADDISEPRRFEEQVAFLNAKPACLAVGTCYTVIDSSGNLVESVALETESDSIMIQLLGNNHLAHASVMFRREAVSGYDERWFPSEDYALWIQLAQRGELANLPEHLFRLRKHGDSVSSKRREVQARKGREIASLHRANLLAAGRHDLILAAYLYRTTTEEQAVVLRGNLLQLPDKKLSLSEARDRCRSVLQEVPLHGRHSPKDLNLLRRCAGRAGVLWFFSHVVRRARRALTSRLGVRLSEGR